MNKINAVITAMGGYVPDGVLTNEDVEKMVDTSDEWITARVGIKERRFLPKEAGRGASYLGIRAVENLFALHPGIRPSGIDLVLTSTNSPDYAFPSTASLIAKQTGIPTGVPCFDFEAGCTGFIYGLQIARGLVTSGIYRRVLLISAEYNTAMTDPLDRSTLPLFGDAAACAVIEPSKEEETGIRDILLGTDPEGAEEHLVLKAGGTANPATAETVAQRLHFIHQDGQPVFKSAVTYMGDITEELLRRNGLTQADLDWVVPHQANLRIIKATAARIGLSMEKVMLNIQHRGNTSSASIPLCIWENRDRIKKGDNLILTAFGAGFTYGCVYLKWAY